MQPLFKLIKITDAQSIGNFFSGTESDTYGPAPLIVPYKSSHAEHQFPGGGAHLSKQLTTVNVTNDYPWTNAPVMGNRAAETHLNPRYDVPSLELREESIQQNPALNNLARNLYIAGDNIELLSSAYNKLQDSTLPDSFKIAVRGYLGAKAGKVLTGNNAASLLAGGAAAVSPGAVGTVLETAGDTINALKKVAGDKTFNPQRTGAPTGTFNAYDEYLAPFQDIYTTKLTGWRYKLPYLDDLQRQNSSQFISSSLGAMQGVGDMGESARKLTQSFTEAFAPGVYIDQAKSYNFTGQEKTYNCEFPLLNTTSQADILRNWQLIFLLTYQNRPNKIDRIQAAPPKIYEAMIPGVWYSRYSYISRMSVQFVGNRRKMTLKVPIGSQALAANTSATGNLIDPRDNPFDWSPDSVPGELQGSSRNENVTITTIIPDAYQVSITLQELIPESQNSMFAAIRKPSTVTTGSFEDGGAINFSGGDQ